MRHELRFTIRSDAPGEQASKVATRVLEQAGLFGYQLVSARPSEVYTDILAVTIVSRSNDAEPDRESRAFYQGVLSDSINQLTKARFVALESSRFIGTASLTKEVTRRLDGAVAEVKVRQLFKGRL